MLGIGPHSRFVFFVWMFFGMTVDALTLLDR